MAKRKTTNAKVKGRRQTYKQKKKQLNCGHSWKILFLIIKAVLIFLRRRRDASIAARLPPSFGSVENYLIPSNCLGFSSKDVNILFPTFDDKTNKDEEFDVLNKGKQVKQFEKVRKNTFSVDLHIIHNIMKKLVSKVCRYDQERKRQMIRRTKIQTINDSFIKDDDRRLLKRNRQSIWYKKKYSENALYREKKKKYSAQNFSYKYQNNYEFENNHNECMKEQSFVKYYGNLIFREKHKANMKSRVLRKYHSNNLKRLHTIQQASDRYHNNHLVRLKTIERISNRYHNCEALRSKTIERASNRYHNSNLVRLKTIERALYRYYNNMSFKEKQLKRVYDQSRRIIKKYIVYRSHQSSITHRGLFMNNLNLFRKIIREGPDYVCVSCKLALFRNQVIAFVETKYFEENMSYEVKERIKLYVNLPQTTGNIWICKLCSDKLKKRQIPSRAMSNNLEVIDVPFELKNLNTLEKHLIALRLPFMKIVNLTSGKISGKFTQKGTKGPLHCVPSDVQDTATILPRPVDKSMMIRLQLKRRLNYKAVWEEQFINPTDVRNALLVLTQINANYKDIKIKEIHENYLISDHDIDNEHDSEFLCDPMNVNSIERNQIDKENGISVIDRLKRVALGDVGTAFDNDADINEDDTDVRSKYNIGTDSCIQPSDFNDFLLFDKEPCIVAPAEKNKLSSLLIDKSIEPLAFPHLFPDGRGSFDEDRVTKLAWKEYCKARLFSSDSRFAGDSGYIFFLQYLGDLKQVFSSINIAFRKKLPLTVKESLDNMQMKFLMNKDMIYRHLQTIRGSPQYWQQRLKDLFSMTRQLGCPSFFVTLSCADLRWKEFIDTFVRNSGGKVKESYTYEEKTKLLRANPVLAARLFEKRFTSFMNLFIKGGAWCLGKVMDWYARIEMQFRGSPHAHMPVWVENAPKYFGPSTDRETREEIVQFCDKFITTRFPSISEDAELHNIIKEVQTHSRTHSNSCLKHHRTVCRFGFPRPVALRTFICEPIKIECDEDKYRAKRAKEILIEMNATLNSKEKEKMLVWSDFNNLLAQYNWSYEDYEWALRTVHCRAVIIHKREPNARWINQYNEEMLRAWDANMDIQYILDPYACAKYLMSYTTKPEREMSLLLETTHKECREGNMSVREEMKKLTGTFFNHRQVSVQEAIYRATKMPLVYSSRGFVFVPAHSNSCRFLKTRAMLQQMDPDDTNIYMYNLADKYFDRPTDPEFEICMADFASNYEIISTKNNIKKPKTSIRRLQTLNFAVKKRCHRNAIIRYPYFNRETDSENYFENLLCLYLPIRSRADLKKPYELFYEQGEVFDFQQQCIRNVKDIVHDNRGKYEAHLKETNELESLFNGLTVDAKEDDWANIVASTRIEDEWSTEIQREENPDFNVIHKNKKKSSSFDLKQTYTTTDEIRPLLQSMNEEQQQVFYYVREWCIKRLHNSDVEPLRLFITGGAGTGKSHLLKCLHYEATRIFARKKHLESDENIDEIHTLITAFTGAAAVNVSGVTIHSAFGIGTQLNVLNENLSCDKLNTYRCKLGSLKLLFVDEVSLIQASLWGAMHSRFTQIMGMHSNTAIFGNIGIIAIGDFYQCSPVASSSIYSSLLWSDHFEYMELKINERQKTNVNFSEMLNRIRKLKKKEQMTKEDRETLEKCHQRYLNNEYDSEALHLFAKNVLVDAHNDKMIEKICTNILTFYEVNNNNIKIRPNESKCQKTTNKTLKLAINARVMITKNLCVNDGLANGVLGRIVDFVKDQNKEVSHIVIKCDSLKVGRLHRVSCGYCHGKDTVCVTRESDNFDREDCNIRGKTGTKQFPLRLSWAITIHKAQGITVDQVVISTKDLFGTGIGYTALSRVRILEGLFLMDLHLDKFYCNENVEKILSQMKPIQTKRSVFHTEPKFLNILFHNIEGLKCNYNALKKHYLTLKADIICLAETWLDHNSNMNNFYIDGYQFFHKIRLFSFEHTHPLHSQKNGGVAIYCRNNIPIKQIDSNKPTNVECIALEIERNNIVILTCYRSPQQNKTQFLSNLDAYLKEINIEKNILLIGDFNEDSLGGKTTFISTTLKRLGFINIFKNLPTTNSLTSLDCIYTNFKINKETYYQVMGSFYSFHEPLILSINLEEINFHKHSENDNSNDMMETNSNSELLSSIDTISLDSTKRKSTSKENEIINKRHKSDASPSIGNSDTNKNPVIKKQIHSKRKTETKFTNCPSKRVLDFLSNIKETILKHSLSTDDSTFATLSEQLFDFQFRTIKIMKDGNCFFRAISHQIYGNQRHHLKLRSDATEYVEKYKNQFRSFISDQDNTIENYLVRMKKSGTYAEHLIITATALALKQNIVIHQHSHRPLFIPGSDYIDEQLHIAYDPYVLHYESVINYDGTIPLLTLTELQQT